MTNEPASVRVRQIACPCPGCRYDLRGLMKGVMIVCPECGGAWTRAQVMTYEPPKPHARLKACLWSFAPAVTFLFLTAIVIVTGGQQIVTTIAFVLGSVVALFTIPWVAIMAGEIVKSPEPPHGPIVIFGGLIVAVVLLIFNVLALLAGLSFML